MRPVNYKERRKKIFLFTGLSAAGLLLACIVIAALQDRGPAVATTAPVTIHAHDAPGSSQSPALSDTVALRDAQLRQVTNDYLRLDALLTQEKSAGEKNRLLAEQQAVRIKALETELVMSRSTTVAAAKPASSSSSVLQKENESLKTSLHDEEATSNSLRDVVRGLRADNQLLNTRLSERAKPVEAAPVPVAAKTNTAALENKIRDLDAELYFTRVDCNLARADAQQIVYNAKQRRELLAEALAMLKKLSASGDADTRKKSTDKLAQLNRIANTLRD